MITKKTADRLALLAHQAGAMAEAIYEHDRQSSDSVAAAAAHLAAASTRLLDQLARYAAAATD